MITVQSKDVSNTGCATTIREWNLSNAVPHDYRVTLNIKSIAVEEWEWECEQLVISEQNDELL